VCEPVLLKFTMAEDLQEMWGKFSLNKDENSRVSLEDVEIAPMVHRGKICLVGKIMVDRIVPKEFFRALLIRAWRPMGEVFFKVLGGNRFIAEFEYEWDKSRIMEGRPWLFDGNLISLTEYDGLMPPAEMIFDPAALGIRMYTLPLACMGRETEQKIDSSVGKVEDVDVNDDVPGWGEFLHVKVAVELLKPLARGRMMHVHNRSIWIAFKYEKLPKFCYRCSVIMHGRLRCVRSGSRRTSNVEDEQPYGPWLRVTFPLRRGMEGDSHSSRWHSARANGDYKRRRNGESSGSLSSGAAMEEEARGDGTCGNPSKLDIVPHLERESFPKVVVNVAIPFQTGKHPREPIVEGDVNADDNAFFGKSIADGIQERKERGMGEESKLYSSFYGKFVAEFIEESTPEASGKLPHKYVG